jgi:hypothetical protein
MAYTVFSANAVHRDVSARLRAYAALPAGQAQRGLLLGAADLLDSGRGVVAQRTLHLVMGRSVGDETVFWAVKGFADLGVAQGLMSRLERVRNGFGVGIDKADLVGLSGQERQDLARHLMPLDPEVHVGRHGVEWMILSSEVSGA